MKDYTLKILVLGDPTTGKEELLKKYAARIFREDKELTIGVEFLAKETEIDGKQGKLQLWDFRGEERSLHSLYSRGANGAFILYDITDSKSLNYVPEWLQIIRENTGDIPILLVGNKLDMEQNREVSKEQIEILKKQYDISSSIEISVKTGENVEKMFLAITEMILEKKGIKMKINPL
ncbi:MAG: Rab family GTPase [Promethearchaeota archaeon]